jgi:hypothetical protein
MVASIVAASSDTGTHTSVEIARQPGRRPSAAKYALWRARQSRLRSSARSDHSKAPPPFSRTSSST